jgi:MFS family permease
VNITTASGGSASHELTSRENARAMKLFHVQAVTQGIYFIGSMPGGLVLQGYALTYAGFTKENAGAISTVVYSAGILQIFSFILMNRFRHKKLAALLVGALEMVFIALLLLLPLIVPDGRPEAAGLRHNAFLALVFCSALCANMVYPVVMAWLGGVVPEAQRGGYLGTRTVLVSLAGGVIGFAAGQAIGMAHSHYLVFVGIITFCCAAGIASYIALLRAPMPPVLAHSRTTLKGLLECFSSVPYRRYLAFSIMVNAAFAVACPYYTAFFLMEVGLSAKQMSWYGAAYAVVRLLANKPLGNAIDRFGTRPVLKAMVLIYTFFFASFFVFSEGHYPVILIVWAIVALADAAYMVAMPAVLFRSVEGSGSMSSFFAVERASVYSLYAIGPILVQLYFHWIHDWRVSVAGQPIEKFRLMYMVCGVIVLASLLAASRVADTRDMRLRGLVVKLLKLDVFDTVSQLWRRD